MTTGDFNGDGKPLDAAVGMPRGQELRGQVVIYDSVLTNLHNVTGNQIGAYFVSTSGWLLTIKTRQLEVTIQGPSFSNALLQEN